MRLACLALLVPGILAAQPAAPIPFPEAEARYLEAWDLREGTEAIPVPGVASKDRAALRWLVNAASQDHPANPFPHGSSSWGEAEGLRHFLTLPPQQWGKELRQLSLSMSGSHLALWRWGQPKVRAGQLDQALRRQWEDRLLERSGPAIVRDLALRHALCFALDEADGDRFAQIKDAYGEDFPDILPSFQNALALLGAPAPVVHLWTLPDMQSVDLSLAKLGGTRVRFEPDPGSGLPDLPRDTVWVVPTRDGSQPEASSSLEGASLTEALQLAPRLRTAGRIAYLAPVRQVFETYALMYFPIQLDLDPQGSILRIRMGDALLANPR